MALYVSWYCSVLFELLSAILDSIFKTIPFLIQSKRNLSRQDKQKQTSIGQEIHHLLHVIFFYFYGKFDPELNRLPKAAFLRLFQSIFLARKVCMYEFSTVFHTKNLNTKFQNCSVSLKFIV